MKPNYVRQSNRHVAVDNIAEILAEIRSAYSTLTLKSIANRIGVKEATINRWQREKIARRAEADALITAFPIPPKVIEIISSVNKTENIPVEALTELFILIDRMKALSDNLKTQIGVK